VIGNELQSIRSAALFFDGFAIPSMKAADLFGREAQKEVVMESQNATNDGSLRHVSRIAWPLVVSSISYTAMNAADTLLVARLGVPQLAGVGLATIVVFLFGALFVGMIHGTKIVVSQATGAQDDVLVDQAGWHGLMLGLAFSVPVIGLAVFDETVLSWMGASQDALGFGTDYLGWRVWAYPFWFGVIALSDYFQGRGEPKTPMRVNLVMNLLNVVLDVVLIFGIGPIPALGVSGAAIATVMSCALGFMWILWEFVARAHPFAGYDKIMVRRIVDFGTPLGLRYFLSNIGFSVFTAIVARLGDDALAAHQIAFKIVGISFIPGYGVSEAATVLAGQFHGAGRRDLIRRSYKNSVVLAVGLMGACGIVFWTIPESLIGVFQAEPAVLALGASLLAVAAVFQVFDAIVMTTFGALNGVGDTRYSMIVLVLGSWFVLVPSAWFFAFELGMGVVGAWIGITVEIFILMIAALWRTKYVF